MGVRTKTRGSRSPGARPSRGALALVALAWLVSLAAPSTAAAWGPLPQTAVGQAADGRTIQDLRLREVGATTVVEVLADQPLVWTSYRDGEGNLVIELPNSTPGAALGDVRQSDGLVSLVIVNMDEGASRPLTRLTVKTREEADHTLSAEGNGLRLELMSLDGDSTLVAESEAPPTSQPPSEPSELAATEPAQEAEMGSAEGALTTDESESVANLAEGGEDSAEIEAVEEVRSQEPLPILASGMPQAPAPPAVPPDGKDFEIVSSGAALVDPATILESVDQLQGGESTALQIRGDGEFTYSSFRLENPDRFVIDLAGVVNASSTTTIPVSSRAVDRVRIAQFKPFPQPVARVVFDLPFAQVPVISSEPSGLTVRFEGEAAATDSTVSEGVDPQDSPAVAETLEPDPLETEPTEPEPTEPEPTELALIQETPEQETAAPMETVTEEAALVSEETPDSPTEESVEVAEVAPAEALESVAYGEEVAGETEVSYYEEPVAVEEPISEEPQPAAAEEPVVAEYVQEPPSQVSEPVAEADPNPAAALPEPVTIVAIEEPMAEPSVAFEEPEEVEVPEPVAPAPVPIIEKPVPTSVTPPRQEDPEARFGNTTKIPTTDVTLFEEADLQRAPTAEKREPLTERLQPEVVGAGGRVYSGDPVSMSLKNADIKDVLKSFAGITGLNVVVHPGVKGSVTVELEGVPWDQALDLILKINGLDYVLEGNIMRIATTNQLSNEADARRKLAAARAKEVPLETVIRSVSYNSATAVAQLLRSSSSGRGRGGSNRSSGRGILSPRASVTVDRLNNKLIIKEVPSNMNTVLAVIDSIDVSIPQVLIEARIVETTKNFSRSLGIQWDFGAVADDQFGNTTGLQFPHRASADGGVNLLTGGRNAFLDISLGNILDTFTLDASLQAAENEGLATILSAPRVTTLNNTTATISSGLQIPIQTTANNTVNVRFVNAGLSMQVTPYVTAEGTVLMDINIAKREPLLAFAIAGAANAPISVKQARTSVIVRDGGTTVIGGIYEVSTNQGEDRVPGLANVPLLGHLFKNRRRSNDNEELLIFITPRVMQL